MLEAGGSGFGLSVTGLFRGLFGGFGLFHRRVFRLVLLVHLAEIVRQFETDHFGDFMERGEALDDAAEEVGG